MEISCFSTKILQDLKKLAAVFMTSLNARQSGLETSRQKPPNGDLSHFSCLNMQRIKSLKINAKTPLSGLGWSFMPCAACSEAVLTALYDILNTRIHPVGTRVAKLQRLASRPFDSLLIRLELVLCDRFKFID